MLFTITYFSHLTTSNIHFSSGKLKKICAKMSNTYIRSNVNNTEYDRMFTEVLHLFNGV